MNRILLRWHSESAPNAMGSMTLRPLFLEAGFVDADKDPAFQKQCLALLEKAYKAGEAIGLNTMAEWGPVRASAGTRSGGHRR